MSADGSVSADGTRQAFHWRVQGRVQGVSYRWFTEQIAQELGVVGWVCNRSDGAVDVEAAGTPEALAQLRSRLQEGPAYAAVEHLLETEIDPATVREERFTIRR